ncbi:uncharacterized protein DFL_007076 [Arthrobotrys flagrans]|uniref:Uncharacterized protein n=1 Tax=Arthrobotrys flagrans TaxID=97331 RepID=A0A436ZUP1_ARTFL|nr:hypothetical protein DFL_007076 [Arthrobotrys flagrans]
MQTIDPWPSAKGKQRRLLRAKKRSSIDLWPSRESFHSRLTSEITFPKSLRRHPIFGSFSFQSATGLTLLKA